MLVLVSVNKVENLSVRFLRLPGIRLNPLSKGKEVILFFTYASL